MNPRLSLATLLLAGLSSAAFGQTNCVSCLYVKMDWHSPNYISFTDSKSDGQNNAVIASPKLIYASAVECGGKRSATPLWRE
jgi:hypothetical protein